MSEAYDAMINWDKRLRARTPFYRRVFEQVKARRCWTPPAAPAATRPSSPLGVWKLKGRI